MNEKTQEALIKPAGAQSYEEDVIDLKEIFYLLLGHAGQILLCMIISALVAFGYTKYMITPLYDATAKIYVLSASNGSVVDLTDLSIGSQLTSDYSELLLSRPLLEDVIDNLDLDLTTTELKKMISITNASDTRILSINVTSADPQEAADIANELTIQALIYLPKIMDTNPPNVVEDAVVPTVKSSPSITRNVLLGAIIGLVISCGFLILRFLMNDTFETPEDVANMFGVMPLAVIPEEEIEGLTKKETGKKFKLKGVRS